MLTLYIVMSRYVCRHNDGCLAAGGAISSARNCDFRMRLNLELLKIKI
jgi:hypothetical protein